MNKIGILLNWISESLIIKKLDLREKTRIYI